MALPDPVLLAIPMFLVTLGLEAWWLRRKGRNPLWKDSATSLGLGLGSLWPPGQAEPGEGDAG